MTQQELEDALYDLLVETEEHARCSEKYGYETTSDDSTEILRASILAEFRKRNDLILRLRNKLDDCAKWMSEAEPYLGGEFLVRQLAERVVKEVDSMKLEVSDG